MTNQEALTLKPGDRIALRPQPTWATNPPDRTTFTVAKVNFRPGYSAVQIVSVEGFRFTPWEMERAEPEE